MTFDATPMNPADIAAMTEFAPVTTKRKRAANCTSTPMIGAPRAPIANEVASHRSQPIMSAPLVSNPIVSGQVALANHDNSAGDNPKVSTRARSLSRTLNDAPAADLPIPDAARDSAQPNTMSPRQEPYSPTPETTLIIDNIIQKHRLRQNMIKARTKLVLQAMASVRFAVHQDGDYDSDEAKAKARKRAEALYQSIVDDPAHPLHCNLLPYLMAIEPLEKQEEEYKKDLVRLAKKLPAYEWAKSVKGLGDVSFATIVGECGDIGTYKSVSAVWKRLGLAVFDGKRQGAPGEGATKEDWIRHGYNRERRSVSWNARNSLILGMGKFRPQFGEDVQANPDLTYLQRVFVERARYESAKLGLPVTEKDNGKESYKQHPVNRAMRYVEKRMLKMLYLNWRRS